MENITKLLKERKQYLLHLRREKEKALVRAPEGCLRICKHGGKMQHYHRKDFKDTSGTYIKQKDIRLAERLAQKDYDKKVIQSAEKEINAISKYLAAVPGKSVEEIYKSLHKERQHLIQPILQTEDEYIADWEQVDYSGKDFDIYSSKLYTAKGERVRSKSEVIIADTLNREKIPYRYEYPIYVEGWGTVHPDFTVLNIGERKEMYWEHLGMMDDLTYVEKALDKINVYAQNGILPGKNLILTFETSKAPLNQKIVQIMIEQYLV